MISKPCDRYSLWVFYGIGCVAEATVLHQLGSWLHGSCLVYQSETVARPDGCGDGTSWELVDATFFAAVIYLIV